MQGICSFSPAWLTCIARQTSLQSNVRDKRIMVMAHAPRGQDMTRIISMRKANRREQKTYDQERPEATGPHDG